jgi:hypothetical protein
MTQVVKVYLFAICLACPFNLFSQSIEGSFNGYLPGDSGGVSLSITKDNRFFQTTYLHLGESHVSQGYYLVKQDTLILFHEPTTDPAPSYYEVIQKTDSIRPLIGRPSPMRDIDLYMELQVVDVQGNPIEACLVLLGKGPFVIASESTDSKGIARISTGGRIADDIVIGIHGYKRLRIDLKNFWGYQSVVKVVLSGSLAEYNDKSYTKKYLITRKKGRVSTLVSVGSITPTRLERKENSDK